MSRLDRDITAALERTGLPWEARPGSSALKIYICGTLVTKTKTDGRAGKHLNTVVSQIERFARRRGAVSSRGPGA